MVNLNVVNRDSKWWIVGHDPEMGPYDTKAEAVDDMRGVNRFYKDNPPAPTLEELLS